MKNFGQGFPAIKKPVFITLLFLAMMSLSSVASYADMWGAEEASCDPKVNEILRQQADAVRLRNQAYAAQNVKRPDSTLVFTCFDQALKQTARLGSIFSDVRSAPQPPSLASINAGVNAADFGAKKMLSTELNRAITPALTSMLGKDFFKDWQGFNNMTLGSAMKDAVKDVDAAFGQFDSALGGLMADLGKIVKAFNKLNYFIKIFLPGTPPFAVPGVMGLVRAARSFLRGLQNQFHTAMNTNLMSIITANLSVLAMTPQNEMDCQNMLKRWNGQGPAGGAVHALIGNGVEKGSPYMNLHTFVNGAFQTGMMGANFTKVLNGSTSKNRLSTLRQINNLLEGPGGVKTWKRMAALGPKPNVDDVIFCMNRPTDPAAAGYVASCAGQ